MSKAPAPSSRPTRVFRWAWLAVLLASASVLNCTSLLGVDDYKDSTSELCDLLEACYQYPDCAAHVGPPLDAASPAERTLWLASLSDKACLEQCSAARRCLNIKPVCKDEGASCARSEDCCDFLSGTIQCSTATGMCCRGPGANCNVPEDCCSQVCSPRTNTCDDEVCSAVGALCKNDFDCCSGRCIDNFCVENICTPLGQACNVETDQCCAGAKCLNGTCSYTPTCRDEGEPCLPQGDPDQQCCAGTQCFITNSTTAGASPEGICSSKGCLPANADCSSNPNGCCTDEGLSCDPYKKLCGEICRGLDSSCSQSFECCSNVCNQGKCACSEGACTTSNDCCGSTTGQPGLCIAGACAPKCNPTSCHNVCVPGEPMDSSSCLDTTVSSLLTQLCVSDPYCCCVKWDDLCAEEAVSKLGTCM